MQAINMIWGIINSPSRAMELIAQQQKLLMGVLIVAVCSGLFIGSVIEIMVPEIMEMKLEQMPAAEARDAAKSMEPAFEIFEEPAMWLRIVSGIFGGISTVIAVAFSGVLFFFVGKLFGGMGSMRQVQGVVMWANVVGSGIASLFKLPVVLAKSSFISVNFSPAILLGNSDLQDPLYQVFSVFDFFAIWMLVLIVIGMQKIHNFDRNKAVMMTVITWFVMNFFPIIFAGL